MKLTVLPKIITGAAIMFGAYANAGLINVPYTGSYDEVNVTAEGGLPAGDFDTIGGLEDVGIFTLIEGINSFYGSINSPSDPADFFSVEIGAGFRLVGATIDWGTNLPGLEFLFPNVPDGFLQQNTWGVNAPSWFFEESSITPEIFTIANLEASMQGNTFDVSPSFYTAPTFSREQGIYNSTLAASGTCAQSYNIVDVGGLQGLSPYCADGIDYKMTYTVEAIFVEPPSDIPEPSTLAIFALGLMGLASRRIKSSFT